MCIFSLKRNHCKIRLAEKAHDNCAILIFINNEILVKHTHLHPDRTYSWTLHLGLYLNCIQIIL